MARGGKIGYKRKTKNKVRLEKNDSDESDEDYNVSEDEEFDESDDDYCSSLAEDELDDSFGKFEDEEDEWVETKVKKVVRPSVRKGSQARKKNGVTKPRKKKVIYSEEEEEDEEEDEEEETKEVEYDDYCFSGVKQSKKIKVARKEEVDGVDFFNKQEENELVDEKPRKKSRLLNTDIHVDSYIENKSEKDKVLYPEEKEDEDNDDFDDEDDEEFTPYDVMKRTRRNPIKKRVLRTKNRSNPSKTLKDKNPTLRKKKTIKGWGWGRRKSNLNSDSGFVSSESSDYEYTISEEEREQVREATEFCKRLTTSVKGSGSLKIIKEEESSPAKKQQPRRKGKQKVVDMKSEAGKQVCGICLSEEGKRTVRGILNCCTHYFCFACILEWSKVESRCPLCKQRFATISRSAQADSLRDAVFPVPERDQIYQPSEEELRGYLDPYENVLCTECLHGGDDALMLLCDLCDSPAHTYCVGLGREVPHGNWYCDGCRPTTLASSNTQIPNPTPDHGTIHNFSIGSSPISLVRETFDLNEEYVPDTPLTPVTGYSHSPRHHSLGHFQATPGATAGSAAATLYDRRRIQGHIRHIRNNRGRQSERTDVFAPASGINPVGSLISHDWGTATQHTGMSPMTMPQGIYLQGQLVDINTPSLSGRETFLPRFSNLRGEAQASTSTDFTFGGIGQTEFPGINRRIPGGLSHQQYNPCNGNPNTWADASTTPYQFREATVPLRTFRGPLHPPF